MHSRKFGPQGRVFLSAAVAALCCMPAQTAWTQVQVPVQLPPGAAPGANVPRETQRPVEAPAPSAEVFSVPRKLDRPVGAEEGPRVVVTRFDLTGAVDRPDAGISTADVRALLEKARAAQPADGYTIVQLEGVAEEVTKYYRGHGLLLAQAFVPVQEVANGVIKIGVLEGKLGEVTVEGNKRYSSKAIQDAFSKIIGEPVNQATAEKALFTLNDYPGLDVYGVFQPGKEIGATNLAIQVRREDFAEYYAVADNYGPLSTGEYRLRAGVTLNAPFHFGDQFSLYGIKSLDPNDSNADSLYGGVEYNFPIPRIMTRFALRYSTSDYNVGGDFSDFSGDSTIGEVESATQLQRSRTATSRLVVSFANKIGTIDTTFGSSQEDRLSVGMARYELSHIDTRFRGVNRLEISASHGTVRNLDPLVNTRYDLSEDFTHYNLLVERWQRVGNHAALVVTARGQLSSELLASFEQFAIGGPENVRGYAPATFFGDEGASATGELIFDAPGFADKKGWKDNTWGQMLKFHVFADYAIAKVNGVPDGSTVLTRDEDFSSYGGAVSFSLPGKLSVRLDVARPFNDADEILDGVVVKSETQFFFTIGYSF